MILAVPAALLVLALIVAPQLWIMSLMKRHRQQRPVIPWTGGEFARHLLDGMKLTKVKVEDRPLPSARQGGAPEDRSLFRPFADGDRDCRPRGRPRHAGCDRLRAAADADPDRRHRRLCAQDRRATHHRGPAIAALLRHPGAVDGWIGFNKAKPWTFDLYDTPAGEQT
jgi:hypothetical protein